MRQDIREERPPGRMQGMRAGRALPVTCRSIVAAALALGGLALMAPAHAQGAPEGAALFAQHCATCHQPDGGGTVGLAPSLKGDHWQRLGAERSYVPRVLLNGLAGAIQVNGQTFVGNMPSFAAQLDDHALAAVATHLRRLQGAADAAAYTAAEFQALRAQPTSPTQTRQLRQKLLTP